MSSPRTNVCGTSRQIRNRQQSIFRLPCPLFYLCLKPPTRPDGLPPIQKGNGQVDLGIEIAVQTSLCAPSFGEDRIDTHLAHAIYREQLISGVEKTLARSGGFTGTLADQIQLHHVIAAGGDIQSHRPCHGSDIYPDPGGI
jgi:hypothetical protein